LYMPLPILNTKISAGITVLLVDEGGLSQFINFKDCKEDT
jgi:hypothetical protein